jgi:uncharacterized protein (TIGR03032 family)
MNSIPKPSGLSLEFDAEFIKSLYAINSSIALVVNPDGVLLLSPDGNGGVQVEHNIIANSFSVEYFSGKLAISHRSGISVYSKNNTIASLHPDQSGRYSSYFSPLVTFHTGDCMVHDMKGTSAGLVVANTRFSSLCLIDGRYNINPVWYPKFISHPAPEDRCHLNGFCMDSDGLRFATAFSRTDTPGGWRERRSFSGIIIDISSDTILLESLVLPHSPRMHNGDLYFCESGRGAICRINKGVGDVETLFEFSGFARGMDFQSDLCCVGLSTLRNSPSLPSTPIQQSGKDLIAGVALVDLSRGSLAGLMKINNPNREVTDVKFLHDVIKPGIGALQSVEEDWQLIEGPPGAFWSRTVNKSLKNTVEN